MDSAAAVKCNTNEVESLLAVCLDKCSAHWRGPDM